MPCPDICATFVLVKSKFLEKRVDMNNIVAIALSFVVIAISGCSNDKTVTGTYADKDGMTLAFKDGKVKNSRSAAETVFTVKGDSLKFQFPAGYPVEVKINSDDTLTTNYGYTFIKVK